MTRIVEVNLKKKMFQIVYYYCQVIGRPFHLKVGDVHTGQELVQFSIFLKNILFDKNCKSTKQN